MSLTFDYISIIRDYILSHPTDILFHRAYYFLIDYKTKEVMKCFDTDMALGDYTVLLDRSECYHRDYCDTFIAPDESDELYPINANDDTDELRIIEREALKKSKVSKEKFFASDCETPYRYIFMSYCIYGLKRNSGKLWFTDQEFAIYRFGEEKVRETEYLPKYDYISPLSIGSSNRRFWYGDDTTVSQVLKKLRYDFKKLLTDYLDGVYYDSENQTATFGNEMFEEFRKFCIQETATFDVLKKTDINVVCRVEEPVIDFFVKCMQSERFETIRMLCMLPKEMLTMRLNDEHFEEPAEQWVERVDIKLVNEALKRYDEREFAVEREAMSKLSC